MESSEARPGLLWRLDPALGLSLFQLLLASACSRLPHTLAMEQCWLGLLCVLAAAAPGYAAAHVPAVREATAAHQPAPCPQDESLAQQEERHVTPRLSTCMLRCAAQAMLEMVGGKTTLSLKLNEGREGEDHEFCWMLHLRCQKGERLTKAFILLNLEQPLEGGQRPPYRLLLTAPPTLRQYLRAHHRARVTRLLSEEVCGFRFDVTKPFRSAEGSQDARMCVKAVCPKKDACRALELGLSCPPFLATLWRSLPHPDG